MGAVFIVDRLSGLADCSTAVAAPNNGDVLTYHAGTARWTAAAPAAGGGAPGGSDNQVQVKSGSAFAGAAGLVYTSNQLRVVGQAPGTVPLTIRPHADTWLPTVQFLDTAGTVQAYVQYDGQIIAKKAITFGDVVPGTYGQITTSGAGANLTILFNVASSPRGELVFASGSNYLNLGNSTSGMNVRLYDANTIDLGQPSFEGGGTLSVGKAGGTTAVSINNVGPTAVPLTVTMSGSQSADGFRFRDSVGAVMCKIDASAFMTSNTGFKLGTTSGFFAGYDSTANYLYWGGGTPNSLFRPVNGAHVAACFKSHASQSVHLVEFQDAGGANGFALSKNAYPVFLKNAAPADAEIAANQAFAWYDATNGAAFLKVRAKTADGTVVSGSLALT